MKLLRHGSRLLLGVALAFAAGMLKADPAQATITAPAGALTVWSGTAVNFAGTTSTDPEGTFAWAFGDGGTGAGPATSHTYGAPGTYTAVLTVTWTRDVCSLMNPDGSCSRYRSLTTTYTASRTVTVLAPPVISAFSASATSVGVGVPVTLSWTTGSATALSLSGVGDVTGTTSAVVHPSGTTTYTLTASNAGGSVTSSVTVTTYTISVGISPGTASLKLGESKAFTGTITPAGHGLSWSASGGSLSGSTFTGTAAGSFTVTVASTEDPTKNAAATVTVSPATVATPVSDAPSGKVFVGGVAHFTAVVSGAVDTGVTWSVNGGGSINASGTFTASAQGTWTVTATSTADPTKKATASIQVVPVIVTVTPGTVTVLAGQNTTFTAAVTGPGSPNQAVTWSVVTAGGGTITSAGVYTAPATAGDYTVKATSVQDGTCSGTATVHVPGWVLKLKKDIVYVGAKEVAEIDATGKTWVTFDDHLGSPRYQWDGTANPVDGTNLIKQKYAPFGESLVDPTTQGKFAKGFTGHEQTDPSGLVYMQARFYAPMFGRFLSPDPARDQHFEQTQSWNIYSYVRNNPTMQTDPTGMVVSVDSALEGAPGSTNAPPNAPTNQDADTPQDLDFSGMSQNRAHRRGGPFDPMEAFESMAQVGDGGFNDPSGYIPCGVTGLTALFGIDPSYLPSDMSLSAKGLDFIKSYEQLSLTPYLDQAGHLTIGYGHMVKPGETFTKITEMQAAAILAADVGAAVSAVNKALGIRVSQNQFDALVSLAFNAGGGAVSPRNTIVREINSGKAVRPGDFTAWAHVRDPKGALVMSRGLQRRRTDEFQMFSMGDYTRDQ